MCLNKVAHFIEYVGGECFALLLMTECPDVFRGSLWVDRPPAILVRLEMYRNKSYDMVDVGHHWSPGPMILKH